MSSAIVELYLECYQAKLLESYLPRMGYIELTGLDSLIGGLELGELASSAKPDVSST
jgi:hypothetical protein